MDPKLPIRSLDYTVIFARLPAMREFYSTVLGFPVHRLNLSIDLQDIAVRISEEQCSMAPWLVSGTRDDIDTTLREGTCTGRDLAWRNTKRKLQ